MWAVNTAKNAKKRNASRLGKYCLYGFIKWIFVFQSLQNLKGLM